MNLFTLILSSLSNSIIAKPRSLFIGSDNEFKSFGEFKYIIPIYSSFNFSTRTFSYPQKLVCNKANLYILFI